MKFLYSHKYYTSSVMLLCKIFISACTTTRKVKSIITERCGKLGCPNGTFEAVDPLKKGSMKVASDIVWS